MVLPNSRIWTLFVRWNRYIYNNSYKQLTSSSDCRQAKVVLVPAMTDSSRVHFFLLHEKKFVMGLDGILSHWIVFLRQYFQSGKRSEEMNRTQALPNNRRIEEVFLHRFCAPRERWKLLRITTKGPGGDKDAGRAALTGRERGCDRLVGHDERWIARSNATHPVNTWQIMLSSVAFDPARFNMTTLASHWNHLCQVGCG